MKTIEILKQLKEIKRKIELNQIGAWECDMNQTTSAVILEDHKETEEETVKYNGWLDDINSLIESLKKPSH